MPPITTQSISRAFITTGLYELDGELNKLHNMAQHKEWKGYDVKTTISYTIEYSTAGCPDCVISYNEVAVPDSYLTARFSNEQYDEQLTSIWKALTQSDPEEGACALCGSVKHRVFECEKNPLVIMREYKKLITKIHAAHDYIHEQQEKHGEQMDHKQVLISVHFEHLHFMLGS